MASKKRFFEKDQPVHVIMWTLADVFKKREDCCRFIFQFQAANLGQPGFNVKAKDAIKAGEALLYGEEIPKRFIIKEHPPFVHLLDFAEVINHSHLYLIPTIENILPVLIQRLGGGFAKYCNLTYKRKGTVFGRRYGSVSVETDFQSQAVTRYVSVINPLDIFQPGWREEGLKDWRQAFKFLENFEFSSFPDRIGKRYAKILAPKEIFEQYSWGITSKKEQAEFRKFIKKFLEEKSNLPRELFLE